MESELFKFIFSRQLIWYKRFILKQPPPWTDDKVLRDYKIINVYRELDKCTIYLINKLKTVDDRRKVLLNVVFYRFFNKFNLYEDLDIRPFGKLDKEYLLERMNRIKKQGGTLFNNAYLISSGNPGQKKHVTILNNLAEFSERLDDFIGLLNKSRTPQESLEVLQTIPMVGPFLACEFWTDLAYFDFFKQGWSDNDFVNIGPGAKWGLEIVFGERLNRRAQIEKLDYLHKIQTDILPTANRELSIGLTWQDIAYKGAYSNYPYLSLTNIEGALCEFRKYWNIKHGKGRRKYFQPGNYLS